MNKRLLIFPLLVLLILTFSFALTAEEAEGPSRLLFVDETRSFEISMRIQGLVKRLKESKEIEVDALTRQVENPTISPVEEPPEEPYDLVIIVPPTIETGQLKQVWLITKPLSKFPRRERRRVLVQLEKLKEAVSEAFEGKVTPVGVNDDLIPAYFSSLFLREGILR